MPDNQYTKSFHYNIALISFYYLVLNSHNKMKSMRGLRVVLFINFLLWATYGLVDLFFPDYLVTMNMGQDSASARHVAAVIIGLTFIIWQTFRNPAKYAMVVHALIILNAIDLLVGIFQSINGTELWKNTITTESL